MPSPNGPSPPGANGGDEAGNSDGRNASTVAGIDLSQKRHDETSNLDDGTRPSRKRSRTSTSAATSSPISPGFVKSLALRPQEQNAVPTGQGVQFQRPLSQARSSIEILQQQPNDRSQSHQNLLSQMTNDQLHSLLTQVNRLQNQQQGTGHISMPPHGLSSLTEASRIRAVAPPKASHSIGSAGLQIGGRNQIVSGNDLLNQLLRSSNLHTENTGNLFAGIAGEQRSSTADTTAWRLGDNAPDKTSVVFQVLVQVLQQYHQQQQQRLFQQQQQEMQMLQQIQNISDQQQQLLFLIQLLSQQQQLQSQNESAPVSTSQSGGHSPNSMEQSNSEQVQRLLQQYLQMSSSSGVSEANQMGGAVMGCNPATSQPSLDTGHAQLMQLLVAQQNSTRLDQDPVFRLQSSNREDTHAQSTRHAASVRLLLGPPQPPSSIAPSTAHVGIPLFARKNDFSQDAKSPAPSASVTTDNSGIAHASKSDSVESKNRSSAKQVAIPDSQSHSPEIVVKKQRETVKKALIAASTTDGNLSEGVSREELTDALPDRVFDGRNPDGRPQDLPVLLVMKDDHIQLSAYQMLLRYQIEVFRASKTDAGTHQRGRNKPIRVGQVGFRCRHCKNLPISERARGSSYFPNRVEGVYQAAQNMNTTHFQHGICTEMGQPLRRMFALLANIKATSTGAGRTYCAQQAIKLGLENNEEGGGIRFWSDEK